jgi:hypothetical protein
VKRNTLDAENQPDWSSAANKKLTRRKIYGTFRAGQCPFAEAGCKLQRRMSRSATVRGKTITTIDLEAGAPFRGGKEKAGLPSPTTMQGDSAIAS